MSFKNMKVKQKITMTILGVALLASISGIVSVFLLHSIQNEYDEGLERFGFAQGEVGMLMTTFTTLDGDYYDVVNGLDSAARRAAKEDINTLIPQVNEHFTAVEATLDAETRAAYNNAHNAWQNYLNTANDVLSKSDAIRTGDIHDELDDVIILQARMEQELEPIFNTIHDNLQTLMDLKVQQGHDLREEADNMVAICIIIVVALVAVALVLGAFMSLKIANGIAKPLAACVGRLQEFAHGDLHSAVPDVETKDEVGDMVEASKLAITVLTNVVKDIDYLLGEMSNGNFNIVSRCREAYVGDLSPVLNAIRAINTNMSDALAQITQSADQVSAGADQVSNSAQALAQGATEQASAVEELSATVVEITQGAEENAKLARDASEAGNQAGAQVVECGEHMQGTIVAMEQIKSAAEEVRSIITTIEDIAFQTNILALNAAVEAARAGSAGKGFAVVADEVRNLASKSDEAAKATKERIENAISAVQNGSRYVEAVSEALEKTKELAGAAVGKMGNIADASVHQAESVEQIREGIEQISAVVQTNSATSEETAAASEQLSSQSQIMDQLMSKFTLKSESGFSPAAAPAPRAAEPSYNDNNGGYDMSFDYSKY